MGGSTRTKRSAAPGFWPIQRKSKVFTVTTAPGPHSKDESYPLAVLVRDVLKFVRNYREARGVIREGKILVDGVVRRSPDFPVGLMDVIEIPMLNKAYRLVPAKGSKLIPVEIPDSEKNLKLCKVKGKTTIRGGRFQYGLHDGRSIVSEAEVALKPDDVCLIETPSQKIIRSLTLKEGVVALIVRGAKAGVKGKVIKIKSGAFSRPKIVDLDIDGTVAEIPAEIIMVVGQDKPMITVTES